MAIKDLRCSTLTEGNAKYLDATSQPWDWQKSKVWPSIHEAAGKQEFIIPAGRSVNWRNHSGDGFGNI